MAAGSFETFLQEHALYKAIYDRLLTSRLMAISSQLVYELHGEALGPVADDILSFVHHHYPPGYVDQYISRVNRMAELQKRFDEDPRPATLDDAGFVDSDAYSLSLLLSIVLTNHRFEIMQELTQFLDTMRASTAGVIVSIGTGTGYELKLISESLKHWEVESYDIDTSMEVKAKQLLDFFGISKHIHFAAEFPLNHPAEEAVNRYDAVVLCEVLEHLLEPAQALETLRECLKDSGKMFVTMAVNIAQEDHVFLYPDLRSCREQIRQCGLEVEHDWVAPQAIRFLPANREAGFNKGNYVAIVRKGKCRQNSK